MSRYLQGNFGPVADEVTLSPVEQANVSLLQEAEASR